MASPPPPRVDKTRWDEGLIDSDGNPFNPNEPPKNGRVNPLKGIAPLAQPDPRTIVLDRWVALPVVSPSRALTRTFAFDSADPAVTPLSFLSVFYPALSIGGTRFTVAGVAYYEESQLVFDRAIDVEKDGEWVAVSVERFFPPERASADYIVHVGAAQKRPDTAPAQIAPVFIVDAAPMSTDTEATSASRSSPESA